ncbi:MAG TPA: GNAT family N-acetyltransferase [Nitriliruptoraceae bacterium]|nr:GNAT family N-acetyltransferase [Nitriliruptoraceae bacterium]
MASDDVVELRTPRATIRPWRMGEADVLFAIRSQPAIAQWLGDPSPWADVEQARDHIAECADKATAALPRTLAVVPDVAALVPGEPSAVEPSAVESSAVESSPVGTSTDGLGGDRRGRGRTVRPIGAVSLFPLHDPDGVSIGWYLDPTAAGNGWASEAATALLDHALASGHDLVWAMMWEHNERSAAVCRRIGMVDVGVHVDPWYGTRQYPDSRFFCAGPGSATAARRLQQWGRDADLADVPDLVPPP